VISACTEDGDSSVIVAESISGRWKIYICKYRRENYTYSPLCTNPLTDIIYIPSVRTSPLLNLMTPSEGVRRQDQLIGAQCQYEERVRIHR